MAQEQGTGLMIICKVKEQISTLNQRHFVDLPMLGKHHCDMAIFRRHPRYRSYANSDLFEHMLNRDVTESIGKRIYLDALPANVTVTKEKLLSRVEIIL